MRFFFQTILDVYINYYFVWCPVYHANVFFFFHYRYVLRNYSRKSVKSISYWFSWRCDNLITKLYPFTEKVSFRHILYIKDSQQVEVLAQTNCTKCYWITNYRNLTSLGKNIRTRTAESTAINGSLKLVYFNFLFMAKVFCEPVYYIWIGRVKVFIS